MITKEVKAYIKLLEMTSSDVPNSTHNNLRYLYDTYGREQVDKELERQFNESKRQAEAG
jgi:hypothetical protein